MFQLAYNRHAPRKFQYLRLILSSTNYQMIFLRKFMKLPSDYALHLGYFLPAIYLEAIRCWYLCQNIRDRLSKCMLFHQCFIKAMHWYRSVKYEKDPLSWPDPHRDVWGTADTCLDSHRSSSDRIPPDEDDRARTPRTCACGCNCKGTGMILVLLVLLLLSLYPYMLLLYWCSSTSKTHYNTMKPEWMSKFESNENPENMCIRVQLERLITKIIIKNIIFFLYFFLHWCTSKLQSQKVIMKRKWTEFELGWQSNKKNIISNKYMDIWYHSIPIETAHIDCMKPAFHMIDHSRIPADYNEYFHIFGAISVNKNCFFFTDHSMSRTALSSSIICCVISFRMALVRFHRKSYHFDESGEDSIVESTICNGELFFLNFWWTTLRSNTLLSPAHKIIVIHESSYTQQKCVKKAISTRVWTVYLWNAIPTKLG